MYFACFKDKFEIMLLVLIDDQQLITGALKILLADIFADAEILSFNNPQTFLDTIGNERNPDVVFVDIIMPEINGIKLIEIARKKFKGKTKLIALSSLRDISTIKNALNIGVNGYLSKDVSPDELKNAIEEVMAGNTYVEKELRSRLLNTFIPEEDIVLQLTDREQEVLNGICDGLSIKEIAAQLYLSHHTVQFYHKNIMGKFKIKKNTELIVFAIRHGLYVPKS